jgi:hypothetical protein
MGRGYNFEVIRARLLFDDVALNAGRATVRKKPRREANVSFGRMAYSIPDDNGTTINYGAHLPTLIHLLEDGHFS